MIALGASEVPFGREKLLLGFENFIVTGFAGLYRSEESLTAVSSAVTCDSVHADNGENSSRNGQQKLEDFRGAREGGGKRLRPD